MPGQTKSEIRALLDSAGLSPRHRLGQNFLIDLNLMRKLVATADVRPDDVILEVGAGAGSLTECLLESGARVVAVEIDRGLQGVLHERLGEHPRLTLVEGDALASKHEINPLVLDALQKPPPPAGGAYKLVANLPYQIATPLLMELLRGRPAFKLLACTIQKEVGERFTAEPKTRAYGPASVICQTLAEIETIATLPAAAFWPRPKIESIMLALYPRPLDQVDVEDLDDFVRFVHRCFTQRRKMLRRIVKSWDAANMPAVFREANVNPDSRPEGLTCRDWRVFHRAVLERRRR